MYIALTGGAIVDKNCPSINIDCKINNNYYIGTLSSYKISQTFENIIYNQAGDINNDGSVNSIDASLILSLYATNFDKRKLSTTQLKQYKKADVNMDGSVNSIDASLTLDYYSKRSTGLSIEKCKNIIKCDLNKDKTVTIEDYYLLQKALSTNKYISSYDLNADRKLNNTDLNYFKTILRQNGTR